MKPGFEILLGMCLLAGANSSASATTVGVQPCDGVNRFAKSFSVANGTTITGAMFTNNDDETVFPSVALVQGGTSSLGEGTTLRTVTNVTETSAGMVAVTWSSPVSVAEASTFYVVITPPEGAGKQGPGDGPAIGASVVASPTGSFLAGGEAGDLVPVGVDFDVSLVGSGFGAGKPKGASPRLLTDLGVARPNPFNPTTSIEFSLGRADHAQLAIFDAGGRLVRRLVQANLPAGRHVAIWDGKDSASRPSAAGVYFARLLVNSDVFQRKLVLVK